MFSLLILPEVKTPKDEQILSKQQEVLYLEPEINIHVKKQWTILSGLDSSENPTIQMLHFVNNYNPNGKDVDQNQCLWRLVSLFFDRLCFWCLFVAFVLQIIIYGLIIVSRNH
jgi:hypothetical protein